MTLVDTSSWIEYLAVRHGLEPEHCDRRFEKILAIAAKL